MTGFGLGWINIAADWSRYQRRDASGAAIVGWNTFGGALAPALLVSYGLALAGSDASSTHVPSHCVVPAGHAHAAAPPALTHV